MNQILWILMLAGSLGPSQSALHSSYFINNHIPAAALRRREQISALSISAPQHLCVNAPAPRSLPPMLPSRPIRDLSVCCVKPSPPPLCFSATLRRCIKASQPDSNSLLWKITGNGLTKASWLFGTMHLICPSDYVWTPAMEKSLASCQKICLEMDMDDPEVLKTLETGMQSDDKGIKEFLTTDQYQKLLKFCKDSLQMDLSRMPNLAPMNLEAVLLMRCLPCSIPVSYEMKLMETAKGTGKEILGLESPEEQLSVMNSIRPDSTSIEILDMVDSFRTIKSNFSQLVNKYHQQNIAALFDEMLNSRTYGMDDAVFLNDRNQKWIPRMTKFMKANSIFFAVGAMHLYGDQGVIHLLRKAGYTVSPIH